MVYSGFWEDLSSTQFLDNFYNRYNVHGLCRHRRPFRYLDTICLNVTDDLEGSVKIVIINIR